MGSRGDGNRGAGCRGCPWGEAQRARPHPVRTGQTSRQALVASAGLAREADSLGYTRYWVAEHHNMTAVASSVPGVLIPYLAAGTSRIRFGSGGVMLPNHAALAIAEQFALLEAMYPGRIDLGIGRAPGSDPVTAYLLRGGAQGAGVDTFEQDVTLAQALLGIGGEPGDAVGISISGRPYELRATPRGETSPDLWLLGSSDYSADLAARLGLPYVFANHFGMPGLEMALARYRASYTPSESYPEPQTLLPVNVVVGETDDEARALAATYVVQMVRLRTGAPMGPQLTVEEAAEYPWSENERALAEQVPAGWYVGTVDDVASRLRETAERHRVDEIMISPVAGARAGDPLDAVPARIATLRALAGELLGA
ncbi:LLM class flavin-dependent oxidoreductase [Serinibacter arcticus]|uniref:LLM class flavin-dependent oxidoreductase n=1 Tax=Serinibacter arcticus TaxID=1655435 RepID=UPI002E2664FC